MDPGNQRYYPLNKIGFNLAGHCQECPRWTLLTKQNHTHSTITINDERFLVNGHAPIISCPSTDDPKVTIDLTEVYGKNVEQVHRTFTKESNESILISDKVVANELTSNVTWSLMTTAEVVPNKNGAMLTIGGKSVSLSIISPQDMNVAVISLDPPPLEIDKTIEGLKRIELRVPAYVLAEAEGMIEVRLSGKSK